MARSGRIRTRNERRVTSYAIGNAGANTKLMKLTKLLVITAGLLIAGRALCQEIPQPDAPPGVTVLKVKWDTFVTTGVASSGVSTNAQVNQNRFLLPGQNISGTLEQTRMYVYSMELSNHGPKVIKAVAWDFIFTDAANHKELARHSLANLQQITVNEKKTLRFTTQATPPKLVSVGGLEKDQRRPFTESVNIQCLLFADNSVWEQPKSRGGACDDLQRWIVRRKKAPPGIEDLPFKN